MAVGDIMHRGDLLRQVEAIRRQLQELMGGRRLENSSIGAGGIRLIDGGSLTISGGSLRMNSADGSVGLLYFGDSSNGGRTWLFSFPDGEVAFGLIGNRGAGYWGGRDNSGNLIMSNDAGSGVGLSRPYIPYRLVPAFEAQSYGEGNASMWPSTPNTTATKIMQGLNPVWHPKISIGIATSTIGGGTARWRLELNGQTVATGAGSQAMTATVPGWGTTIKPGDTVGFDLYGWCDGADRAWFQCDRLYGRQS